MMTSLASLIGVNSIKQCILHFRYTKAKVPQIAIIMIDIDNFKEDE